MKISYFTYFLFSLGFLFNQNVFAQEETQKVAKDSIVNENSAKSFEEKFFKALSERGIENYDKAIDILNELAVNHQDEPVLYFQLGLNYFDIENYDQALKYLEKARSLKPNDNDVQEAIFKVYEQQKKYTQAIEIAETLAVNNTDYHEVLANLYLITGKYQKALNALDKADQAKGFDVHKDKLREIIYEEFDQPEIALDYYKRRIDLEPYNPLNHYRLIQFLASVNNYEEAISALETALHKHPGFTRFYVLQTQIYIRIDQKDKALDALEVVVSDRFLEEKYKSEAINAFKSYVETHPEAQNDFVQILDVASETAKDNSSFLDLGMYYFETDKARSLENFKKAKEQNPLDFQILKYTCVLQYQLNKFSDAIKTSDEALEIFPTQAIFMLIKGQSLVRQAQYNEAKSVLLDALSYVFEENEIMQKLYESLSLTYQGLNQPEKAADYQTKADAIEGKLN